MAERHHARTSFRKHLRNSLVYAQGHRCFYCKRRMGPPSSGQKREATIDHRVPRSAGGGINRSNAVAACRICNEAKADLSEAEFREVLREFNEDEARER